MNPFFTTAVTRTFCVSFLTTLSASLLPLNSQAAGIGLEYQSVRASARGNAFVAAKADPALIHYNPGGLVFLERPAFQSNTIAIIGDLSFDRDGTNYSTSDDFALAGATYYAHPFEYAGRSYAFGIGLTTPYGQGITWDNDVPFRDSAISGDMKYVQLHLAAATEITKGLGFGAELLVAYSDLETRSGIPGAGPTSESEFEGDDFAYGYQLGVHYSPRDDWRFGINYRSRMSLDHDGDIDLSLGGTSLGSASANLSFELPEHISFGFEHDLTEKLTLAVQAQWTSWSDLDGFFVRSSALGDTDILVDWDNSWLYSVGLSYKLTEKTTLHGGYMYAETLIDDSTRTPTVSDFEQQFFSVGVSREIGDWTVDAALIYVYSKDENVSGSIYGTDGTFENSGGFVNLAITREF